MDWTDPWVITLVEPAAFKLLGLIRHEGITTTSTLVHPNLKVMSRLVGPATQRIYHTLNGVRSNDAYKVHNSNVDTTCHALLERVYFHVEGNGFAPPHKPSTKLVFSRLRDATRFFKKKFRGFAPIPLEVYPQLVYTGRRLRIYSQAANVAINYGYDRTCSYLGSFVKAEKNPKPVPRIIQPRQPLYNVLVGRYIRQLEHPLYKCIQNLFKSSTPIVMKGLNPLQIGHALHAKFSEFQHPVAIGLDASRFDQHISEAILKWEHNVYNIALGYPKELGKLLRWQIFNRGFARPADGYVKYAVNGCRMSGDMNTAMGNCLIMCVLVWCFCKQYFTKFQLINNGDDCVVILEAKDLAQFSNHVVKFFQEMGFIMKVETPVYKMEHIEFCQCKPILTGEGYLMVRSFPSALFKDSLILKPLTTLSYFRRYLRTVGEAGLSLTGGVPVFQHFYQRLAIHGDGKPITDPSVIESGFFQMARGMNRSFKEITPESRVSFYDAFNVLPDHQIAMEEFFDTYSPSYDKDPFEVFSQLFSTT